MLPIYITEIRFRYYHLLHIRKWWKHTKIFPSPHTYVYERHTQYKVLWPSPGISSTHTWKIQQVPRLKRRSSTYVLYKIFGPGYPLQTHSTLTAKKNRMLNMEHNDLYNTERNRVNQNGKCLKYFPTNIA